MKKLSAAQKARLEKHAKHHTKPHMARMKRAMRMGANFAQAHAIAQRKGK